MNRDIKFRAWDEATKKMIDTGFHIMGEVMAFGLIDQYISEHMEKAETSLERWNDIVIMQFTGAKDADGEEIYEGDIIKLPDDRIGKVVYSDNLTAFLIIVDRVHYNFSYPLVQEQDGVNKNKIIGNIFENPELLED